MDFTEWRFLGCRRLVEDWGSVLCKVIQGVENSCDENHALEEWIVCSRLVVGLFNTQYCVQ